jgi:hypothetical protein
VSAATISDRKNTLGPILKTHSHQKQEVAGVMAGLSKFSSPFPGLDGRYPQNWSKGK